MAIPATAGSGLTAGPIAIAAASHPPLTAMMVVA